MTNPNYMRQKDLFDPINQRFRIIVLGAGSLGSFIALNLAKLGFNNIEVWDFDFVEAHNLPNQFYRIQDIDKQKVEALKEMIKDFTGIEIVTHNEKVVPETDFGVQLNDLFILTFDSLEQRKMFFNLIKNYGCHVIDARCGGEEYNIQTINLAAEEQVKSWEESFNIVPTELPCGAKSIIYTNLSLASEVCSIVKKLNNREKYPQLLKRHMKSYLILNDQEKKQ